MKRRIFFLFSTLTLSAATVNSWAGRSGFQLLNRPFGVATISRGEAGTALPGSFSRWYNPALYGADSGYSMEFEISRQTEYSERTSAAFDLGIRFNDMFLGFEGSNHVEGAGYPTDDFGTTVPDMSGSGLLWQSSELSLSVGRKRTKNLTWGGTIGTSFDQIDGDAAYSILLGLGLQARFFEDRFLLGLSGINWGISSPMINDGAEEFGVGEDIPSKLRFGLAWDQPLKSGKIAVAGDAVYHHTYDTTRSVSDEMGDRFSYPLGIEYSPVKWVDLRAGHEINNGIALANFGAGLNTRVVDADLGFVVNKFGSSRELNWMASVKFHLEGAKKEVDDPYKDKKRAVYRPFKIGNSSSSAIDDFSHMADSAEVEPVKVEPVKVEPVKVEPVKVDEKLIEKPVLDSTVNSSTTEEELGLE